MKQLLLILAMGLGLTLTANAQKYDQRDVIHTMSPKEIKKMDRKHTKYRAQKRYFKTQKEYLHSTRQHNARVYKKYTDYRNGYNYHRVSNRYEHQYKRHGQRGYHQWKRGWLLAYRYDRASFYDKHGYYYGYFNHQGYYFEDVFYRYDRYYTFQDRVRGKGVFDRRYYMPLNSRHYGFI